MTDTAKDPNILKLKNVRLSYPNLFVAKAGDNPDAEPNYSASFLLDKKEHRQTIELIEKTIERAALDFFKKKVPLKNKCLHDGNEKSDKEGYGDEVMYVSSKNTIRPVVVDRNLSPITKDDNKVYGGCYVNATIRLFAYDHKTGGKGVSASLRAVQFVKDGPSFGAGPVNAEDEFESLEDSLDDL